jgi:hypothetical protein
VLRHDAVSLGLPIAYLFSLLLIHLPGVYVYVVSDFEFLQPFDFIETGAKFTAIASVSFVAGVWGVQIFSKSRLTAAEADDWKFSLFCLIGGWVFVYALSRSLQSVPP